MATILVFYFGYVIHGYSPFDSSVPEEVLTYARTLAFMTLILAQMFFALSIRSEYHLVFSKKSLSNPVLWGSIFLAIVLQLLILYIPTLSALFHLGAIRAEHWMMVIGLATIPLLFNEL